MGGIPKLPYKYSNQLILFYLSKGINAFYFDFAARNPMIAEADLLDVFKLLVQERVIDHTFMYAYNVSPGRLSKTKEAVTSKNIFAFGFGFDGMGRKHKRPKFDIGNGKCAFSTGMTMAITESLVLKELQTFIPKTILVFLWTSL
jgi:hypothetical protein